MEDTAPATIVDAGTPMALETTASQVLAEAQAIHAGTSSGQTGTKSISQEETPAEETSSEESTQEDASSDKKGLSWNDALKRVPPDVAKLMRKMQADYTRKTQDLSKQRKEFLREREALRKGAQVLESDKELPEYDPYNESSIQARIEAEVNKRLKAVLEPMQQEYEVMQAEDKYQSFLAEHPDFESDTELRSEVQALLEANEALDLNTAYWAAKGKRKQAEATHASAKRKARKEAALKGTGRARKGPAAARPSRSDLKTMDAASILQLARSMNGVK